MTPDLLFVSHARADILRDRIIGAPDLVIEVLSPRPRIGSLDERIAWFASYGVEEIWLLHQDAERFEVLLARHGRIVEAGTFDYATPLASDVLPAFTPGVSDILAE